MSLCRSLALFGVFAMVLPAQTRAAMESLDRHTAYEFASTAVTDHDSRKRAWAAELITRYHLEALYPKLIRDLAEFEPPASGEFGGSPEELAAEVILNAIVQLKIPVMTADARKLYPEFPALALLLLSRTIDDKRAALLSILNDSQVAEVWLAAANLLAEDPPPGFVDRLVGDLNLFVRILVFAPGQGGGAPYGDCYSPAEPASRFSVPTDWPDFPVYSLEFEKQGERVFAPGANPIGFSFHISLDTAPWRGRFGCTSEMIKNLRRDLIVQLAGMDPSLVKLRAVVLQQVDKRSDEQYRQEITKILLEQEVSFTTVIDRLRFKGLITRTSPPRLQMKVNIVPMVTGQILPAPPDLSQLGIDGEYQGR